MSSIHYGQSIFEGMKAFRKDGEVYTFRAKDNFARLNRSADRMCMPNIPNELVMNGLKELLRTDKEWIPENEADEKEHQTAIKLVEIRKKIGEEMQIFVD